MRTRRAARLASPAYCGLSPPQPVHAVCSGLPWWHSNLRLSAEPQQPHSNCVPGIERYISSSGKPVNVRFPLHPSESAAAPEFTVIGRTAHNRPAQSRRRDVTRPAPQRCFIDQHHCRGTSRDDHYVRAEASLFSWSDTQRIVESSAAPGSSALPPSADSRYRP